MPEARTAVATRQNHSSPFLRRREQGRRQKRIGREGPHQPAGQRHAEENQSEHDAERELRAGIEQHGGIPDQHGEKRERPAAERVERPTQPPRGEDGEGHDRGAHGAGGRAGEQAVEQHDGRDDPGPAPAHQAAKLQQNQRDHDHLRDVLALTAKTWSVPVRRKSCSMEHAGEKVGRAWIVLKPDLQPRVGPIARAEGEILPPVAAARLDSAPVERGNGCVIIDALPGPRRRGNRVRPAPVAARPA